MVLEVNTSIPVLTKGVCLDSTPYIHSVSLVFPRRAVLSKLVERKGPSRRSKLVNEQTQGPSSVTINTLVKGTDVFS